MCTSTGQFDRWMFSSIQTGTRNSRTFFSSPWEFNYLILTLWTMEFVFCCTFTFVFFCCCSRASMPVAVGERPSYICRSVFGLFVQAKGQHRTFLKWDPLDNFKGWIIIKSKARKDTKAPDFLNAKVCQRGTRFKSTRQIQIPVVSRTRAGWIVSACAAMALCVRKSMSHRRRSFSFLTVILTEWIY